MTDADRLQAKGVPITLDDGSEIRIRFDMEALKELEKNFGDLDTIIRELRRQGWKPGQTGKGAMETITYLLWATLLHTEWEGGKHKYPGRAEQYSHMLDSARLMDSSYLTALNAAMLEVLPEPTEEDRAADAARRAEEAADPNANGSRDLSLGSDSTPTPQVAMAAKTGSSGA
jgi:hypothetical protein